MLHEPPVIPAPPRPGLAGQEAVEVTRPSGFLEDEGAEIAFVGFDQRWISHERLRHSQYPPNAFSGSGLPRFLTFFLGLPAIIVACSLGVWPIAAAATLPPIPTMPLWLFICCLRLA